MAGRKEAGPGPRWERVKTGQLQTDKVRIDPSADWFFGTAARETATALVLLGLREGVAPRRLAAPPKPRRGKAISPADWRRNLSISPAFLQGSVDGYLQRAGYCTAVASRTFFTWLVENPDVQDLIRVVTLSSGPAQAAAQPVRPRHAAAGRRASVVLGVIDDWIGIANRRFRTDQGGTRCLSLWLQGVSGAPPAGQLYGRELGGAEINAHLAAAGADEEAFERGLFPAGKAIPSQRLTHGTHVADLFAGYGARPPAEAATARDRPMVVVALPPKAVRDTSGLSLAAPVFDAIVHILTTVRPPGSPPPVGGPNGRDAPPVVINFSYGFLADIGYQISDLREAISGLTQAYNAAHPAAPLVIVTAAGNGFQAQMHARLPRAAAASWSVDLRVLPDDRTRSYVTLELPPGARRYALKVTAPGLPPVTVDGGNLQATLLDAGGQPMALAQFDPPTAARPVGVLSLAINATADPLDGSGSPVLAPHGVWRLSIGGADTASGYEVHGFVARDEAAPGAPISGRQARFEDPAYRKFDARGRPGQTDDPASAVHRGGCINLLGVSPANGPVSIAACFADSGSPTHYSAGGHPLAGPLARIRGPDAICDADHSEALAGVLAAGTHTGAVVAMNGTSVSAPQAARRIADSMAAGGHLGLPVSVDIGRTLAFHLATGGSGMPPQMPADPRGGHGRIAMSGLRNTSLAALRRR